MDHKNSLPTAEEVLREELSKLPTSLKMQIGQWDSLIDSALEIAMIKYGKLIVDECAGNFVCSMEEMDLPQDGNDGYLDMDGKQVYPVLMRASILEVKNKIK